MTAKRSFVNVAIEMDEKLLARLVVQTAANLKKHVCIGQEEIKDVNKILKMLNLEEDCWIYSLQKIKNLLYKTIQAEAEFVFDFSPRIKKFLDTEQSGVISDSMWLTTEEIDSGYLTGKVPSNRNWQERRDQFLPK